MPSLQDLLVEFLYNIDLSPHHLTSLVDANCLFYHGFLSMLYKRFRWKFNLPKSYAKEDQEFRNLVSSSG
jgi:hypothetical protein